VEDERKEQSLENFKIDRNYMEGTVKEVEMIRS
jgi:hypothetical protein